MKQKGFAPVIIILALALVGALGYIAYLKGYFNSLIIKPSLFPNTLVITSPSPVSSREMPPEDPTAGWKTYTNNVYSFVFKYPPEYYIKTSDDLTGATSFIVFVYPDNKFNKLLLTINFDKAIVGAYANQPGVKTEKPTELPSITIEGASYPVTKYHYGEGTPGTGGCSNSNSVTTYVASIANKVAVVLYKENEIGCNPDGSSNILKQTTEKEFQDAVQMVSTLKFTK